MALRAAVAIAVAGAILAAMWTVPGPADAASGAVAAQSGGVGAQGADQARSPRPNRDAQVKDGRTEGRRSNKGARLPCIGTNPAAAAACGAAAGQIGALVKEKASDLSVGKLVRAVVGSLFVGKTGLEEKKDREKFYGWLLSVPNYAAEDASAGGRSATRAAGPFPSGLARLERVSRAIGLAILAAVVTLSVISYWGIGLTGGGGEILQAITRSVGAGLFILAWPWIYEAGAGLANAVSWALVGDSLAGVADFFGEANPLDVLTTSTVALIFTIFLTVPLTLGGIVLGLTKLGLDGGSLVVFVTVPIAAAIWPIPGLAWLLQFLLKVSVAVSAIPIAWAAAAGGAIAIGLPGLSPGNNFSWGEGMGAMLTVLGVLLLMLKLSPMMLRAAGVMGGGGGFVRSTISFAAGRLAFGAVSRFIPDRFGGMRDTLARQQWQDQRQAYRDLNQGRVLDPRAAEHAAYGEAARREAQAADRMNRGRVQDPRAAEHAAYAEAARREAGALGWSPPAGANVGSDGLHAGYARRPEAEIRGSEHRIDPAKGGAAPTYDGLRDAYYALGRDQRRGVRELVHPGHPGTAPHPHPHSALAGAASVDGITPRERQAYRTLLDGAKAVSSRPSFEAVAALPVNPPPVKPPSSGGTP